MSGISDVIGSPMLIPNGDFEPWTPQLRFVVGRGATLPTRAHDGDAGLDISLSEGVTLERDHITMCHTGLSVEIPDGFFGLLTVRSSIGCRGVMLVTGASIIDAPYRGEIGIPLVNLSSEPVRIEAGDRVAQLTVIPCVRFEPIGVARLSDTDRGAGGFGSSGR